MGHRVHVGLFVLTLVRTKPTGNGDASTAGSAWLRKRSDLPALSRNFRATLLLMPGHCLAKTAQPHWVVCSTKWQQETHMPGAKPCRIREPQLQGHVRASRREAWVSTGPWTLQGAPAWVGKDVSRGCHNTPQSWRLKATGFCSLTAWRSEGEAQVWAEAPGDALFASFRFWWPPHSMAVATSRPSLPPSPHHSLLCSGSQISCCLPFITTLSLGLGPTPG